MLLVMLAYLSPDQSREVQADVFNDGSHRISSYPVEPGLVPPCRVHGSGLTLDGPILLAIDVT